MKPLTVLACLALALVGVASCSSSTQGQPSAVSTTAGGPPESTSGSTGATALPANHPCSLLSASDLNSLGVSSPPTQGMVGTAHTCEADTAADHIIVGIRTNGGLSVYPSAAAVHDVTIGTHPAKEEDVNSSSSSCVIAIGVSTSSRVDVTVTGDGTTDPCPTAMNVAKLVEPKLP